MEIVRLGETSLEEVVEKAVAVLKAGGIVAYPTDTVYGLGVDAFNEHALHKLRTLKRREKKRPISIVVAEVEHLKEHGELNEHASRLADAHLPGALTLVLPAKDHIPESLTFNGGVGIRVPNDPLCRALAKAFHRPFTTTSANQTRLSTPKSVDELVWHFGNHIHHIDLIIDRGPRDGGLASTVVSCVGAEPQILREGVILRKDLGL